MRFEGLATRDAMLTALAIALLATTASCKLDHIDVSVSGAATIPAATPLDPLLGALRFTGLEKVDFTQQFQNQGVSKGDVDSVHPKSFGLAVTSPAGGNFDFLRSIAFFAATDGQPKIRIAHLDAVPKGQAALTLDVDEGAELKPYVVAPHVDITTSVDGGRPPQETTIRADLVFDVNLNITGS